MIHVQPLADDWGRITPAEVPHLTWELREVARMPGLRAVHRQLFDGLRLKSARRVLEVGCGPWLWERTMRSFTGDETLLVGVDLVADFVNTSDAPHLLAGDGHSLPFRTRCFDAVFCSRLLTHIGPANHIIGEMIRVTRPGGMVGAFEWTFGQWEVDDDNGPISDAIHQAMQETHYRPQMGIELPDALREAGLAGVTVVPYRERITDAQAYPFVLPFIRRHVDVVIAQRRFRAEVVENWYERILDRVNQGRFGFTRTGMAAWGRA